MPDNFYITTTLAYVNAKPHIGFALENVRADVLARWHRSLGQEVFFNTGTDEHGAKVYLRAKEENLEPIDYCNSMVESFKNLKTALDLSYDNFIRTTDPEHEAATKEFWKRCADAGDIYKKNYEIKYCVGCELEKTESELVNDKCPDHPDQDLEIIKEENYFFKFSKYEKALLEFYRKNSDFVAPNFRFNEIKKFIESGLEDFSISRLKSKMPWGIEVPGDKEQVMYVWFDALINYISCLNWPSKGNFEKFWPGMQICGKDNLRQQSAMWQAMLMSAGLPNSIQILINGFITSNGQKMSKSLGNVVDPIELAEKYSTDAVRYYLLAEMNPFEDSDYSDEKFITRYQADLANGLGNLVARVSNLLEQNKIELDLNQDNAELQVKVGEKLDKFLFNEAIAVLWDVLRDGDEKMSQQKPWAMDNADDIKACLEPIAQNILNVAKILKIFLPQTAEKIIQQFTQKQISKGEQLFPRINN
ncbi:MAG: methionine--tRNA ligase [bacterium]